MSINQHQTPNSFATTVVNTTCISSARVSFSKFFKRSVVILAAFLLGQIDADAGVGGSLPVTNVNTSVEYATLQAAISAAASSQTLRLNTDITEGQIDINLPLTIDGNGKTITSTSPARGIEISAANVTITSVTIMGDNIAGSGKFGLLTGCSADNLTLTNVTIDKFGATGFAITGSDNSTFNGLTATNNKGNGISITNCSNVSITGITTSGNSFAGGFSAGVGIFTSPDYCPGGGPGTTSGITLTGAINISEPVKSYQQAGTGIISTVTFNPTSGSTGAFTHYMGLGADKFFASSLTEAKTLANNTILSNAALKALVHIQEISSGKKLVFATAPAMSIQAAVNNSINSQTIEIDNGTYNEQVLVNKEVKLLGVGASKPVIDFTGTPTGKPTLFDITANNVTIENISFNVDLSKLRSAVIGSSANLDAITVKDNTISAYGSPSGSYGDRNAVSINYGGSTNYRVATGGVNSVIFTGNTVSGTGSAYFRSGISLDEGGLTATGNTLTSINHDVLLRFASNGTNNISNNTFNGGGMELSDQNAGSGTITVSTNTFTAVGAPGAAVLRVKNNNFGITHQITNNTFTGFDWAISLENMNSVTVDQNTFTGNATTDRHVVINTKSISSNSNSIVQVPVAATLTKNNFNGQGIALTMQNHDSDNDSYGTFTIGGTSNENNFSSTLTEFVRLDNQTGISNGSTFPVYPTTGGWSTTMACWDQNHNIHLNKFDAGNGLKLPFAMDLTEQATMDTKLFHNPDASCTGVLTYLMPAYNVTLGFYYPTIQAAIDAAIAGNTIAIAEGTYNENLSVTKNLTFEFTDNNNVTIGSITVSNGNELKHNKKFNVATFTNNGTYTGQGFSGSLINNGTISSTQP